MALTENQMTMIEMYFRNEGTAQEIAEKCGYKNKRSVYDALQRPEGKAYLDALQKAAIRGALSKCMNESINAAERIIEISKGKIEDKNKGIIYAILNANTKILDIAGVNPNLKVDEDNIQEGQIEQIKSEFEEFKKLREQEKESK